MCTACVSMRGLIYRPQGCLVSLTSTVNTVILNLHPAKGSKLRNNYARLPTRRGRSYTPCTRGVRNILYGFECTTPRLPLEGDNTLRKKKEREREERFNVRSIKLNEGVNFIPIDYISLFSRNLIFFPSKDWTCLRRPISR